MNSAKTVVFAKIESGYGTDAFNGTPAAETVIVTSEPKFELQGKTISSEMVKPFFGKEAGKNIGEGLKLSFSTELKSSGIAGTAPRIGSLLQACNFTESVEAAKVTYKPNSKMADSTSVTLYFYIDGILHKVTGARGTAKLSCKANEIAKIDFDFTGLFDRGHHSLQDIPALSYEASEALVFGKTNAFVYNSENELVLENFNLDISNTISKRVNANKANGIEEYFISNREVKGDFDPEIDPSKNFWNDYADTNVSTITASLGEGAGKVIDVVCNNCTIDVPSYANRESLVTQSINFTAHPDSGDDELTITFV